MRMFRKIKLVFILHNKVSLMLPLVFGLKITGLKSYSLVATRI